MYAELQKLYKYTEMSNKQAQIDVKKPLLEQYVYE